MDEQIETAARVAHEVNRAYCAAIGDDSQVPWEQAPEWQRESAIAGVRAVLANPHITPREQHESWRRRKIEDGWTFGTEKNAERKTHPCLVDYDSLPAEQKAKDAIFGAVVRGVMTSGWMS